MVSVEFWVYLILDFIMAGTGGLILAFSIITRRIMFDQPLDGAQAARNLLYQRFPLEAGIANAVLILVTFLITIPGLTISARGWLKFAAFLAMLSGIVSLILGLDLWITTLKTKSDFAPLWNSQSAEVQGLMQATFNCCGYYNSSSPAFVTDTTCPSPAAAALVRGCANPLTSYVNIYTDYIFTSMFGIVGINLLFLLATACFLKERKEKERFRHIDEKSGRLGYM